MCTKIYVAKMQFVEGLENELFVSLQKIENMDNQIIFPWMHQENCWLFSTIKTNSLINLNLIFISSCR